jgi:hypothetical protein
MSAAFFQALQARGWNLVPPEDVCTAKIPSRYPELPKELSVFLGSFSSLCSDDETQWILATRDYEREPGSGFAWNEYERMSLAVAAKDASWLQEIAAFWKAHLPIFMSVKGFYSYAAYCFSGPNAGLYVSGCEPEFEDVSVVASDLTEFQSWLLHEVNT